METLLTKIRAALYQERYAFLTLEENVHNYLSKDDDLQVEIAIAPVLGIYRIEANDYWMEEGKGLRFRFEPGDLQPAKADRVENKERIYGWFEGKEQPDTLFLPHVTTEEVVGTIEKRNSKKYCIFPSYRTEVATKQSEKSRLVDGLERTTTIICYPSKEFYEEKLRQMGVVLDNSRAINIPNYNQHFKGKPNYF